MTRATTTREALIAEAVGETGRLLQQLEVLAPKLNEVCQAVLQADLQLHDTLAGFEPRMAAIAENAKRRTVYHLAAQVEESTQRSIEQQTRAMAEAARVAFGAELGATLQRLQAALQRLSEQPQRHWACWLTHLATGAAASATTWVLARHLATG